MSLLMDPQIGAVLAPMLYAIASQQPPPVGDVASRRAWFTMAMQAAAAAEQAATDVEISDFSLDRRQRRGDLASLVPQQDPLPGRARCTCMAAA